jgi:phage terminase small subunit
MVTTPGRKSSDALAAPSFGPERLRPPADLEPKARAIFLDIVTAARAGHFEALDSALLCAYCRASAIERECAARIMTDPVAAPALLETYKAATAVMRTLAVRLRIGPQSRAGHTNPRTARAGAAMSYYDQQRLAGGQ